VEEGVDLVQAEQGRGVARGHGEVADQVADRIDLAAVTPVLGPVGAAPGALALAGSGMKVHGAGTGARLLTLLTLLTLLILLILGESGY
jgi:hypothetical protein